MPLSRYRSAIEASQPPAGSWGRLRAVSLAILDSSHAEALSAWGDLDLWGVYDTDSPVVMWRRQDAMGLIPHLAWCAKRGIPGRLVEVGPGHAVIVTASQRHMRWPRAVTAIGATPWWRVRHPAA